MPNDNGYVIDFETLQRISKSVREQERGVTKAGMADQSQADQQEGTAFVEVTGAATTAGYYPAREKWYDIESNTWTYAQDPCVAWEMNGSTLDSGKTYKGTLARSVVEGGVVKHVFAVQASGGGGAAGSTLIIVKLTNTVAMTGLQQTYNPTTKGWTDGVITLNLVEINGNTMPVNKRMPALLISGTTYAVGLDPAAVTSVTCAGGSLTVAGRN
jgi:hypothetical protein